MRTGLRPQSGRLRTPARELVCNGRGGRIQRWLSGLCKLRTSFERHCAMERPGIDEFSMETVAGLRKLGSGRHRREPKRPCRRHLGF